MVQPMSTRQQQPMIPIEQTRSHSVSKSMPPSRVGVTFQEDVRRQLREQKQHQQPSRPASTMRSSSPAIDHNSIPLYIGIDSLHSKTKNRGNKTDTGEYEDPDSVARAILDLRERREQQAAIALARKQQQQNFQQRSQSSVSRRIRDKEPSVQNTTSASHAIRSSSTSRVPSTRSNNNNEASRSIRMSNIPGHNSSSSKESQHQNETTLINNSVQPNQSSKEYQSGSSVDDPAKLTKRLQNTEKKIDGLMQELDDLKFLEEIDQVDPTAPPARSQSMPRPRPQSPPKKQSQPQIQPQQQQQQQQEQQQQHHYAVPMKKSRGDTVPVMIQAKSAGRLLLPPPPHVLSSPALEDNAPLPSPRQISKLDRLALELETQTLCRKVEVLRHEKQTLMAQSAMYETLCQDQEHNLEKVRQLEAALAEVCSALNQAKAELQAVREQTLTQYEQRLHDNVAKLQATQAEVDKLRSERDAAQHQLVRYKAEMDELRNRMHSDYKANETVLELQLQEVTDLAEELQKELQEKESELLDLQEKYSKDLASKESEFRQESRELRRQLAARDGHLHKLTETVAEKDRALEERAEACNQAYEVQLSTLNEQLNLERSRLEHESNENRLLQQKILDKNKQVNQFKKATTDQSNLITEMTDRLESVHLEYREKYKELRDSFEAKEKRRLDEMVQEQQRETMEYCQRIKSLQEQLTLATDRHHSEIQQKDKEMHSKLEAQRDSLRREIEIEYRQQLYVVEERLATMKQEYEHAEEERNHLRKVADAAPMEQQTLRKQLQRDWEHLDLSRQKEINRLHEKLKNLFHEVTDKDRKINEYVSKLAENESQHLSYLLTVQSAHAEEINRLKEDHENEKTLLQDQITEIRDETIRKENEFDEIRLTMASKIDDLTSQLAQSHELKRVSNIENQSRIEELQLLYDQAKNELLQDKKQAETAKELQGMFEQTQAELKIERIRNERSESDTRVEIAVLEGNIRAANVSAQLNRERLIELEEKLLTSDMISDQLHGKIQNLQNDLDDSIRTIESQRAKILDQDRIISYLQDKADSAEQMDQALQAAHALKEELQHQINALQAKYDEAMDQISSERTRNENVEAKMRVEISMMEGTIRNSTSRIQKHRSEYEQTVEASEKELDSVQSQLQLTTKDLHSSRRELEELQNQSDVLQKKYESLCTEKSLELDQLKSSIAKLEQKEQDLIAHLANMEDQFKQAVNEISLERSKNDTLQTKLMEKSSSFEQLQSDLVISQKDAAHLQEQVEDLQSKVRKCTVSFESERASLEIHKVEVANLKKLDFEKARTITELEESLAQASDRVQIVKSRYEEVQLDLNRANDRFMSERAKYETTEKVLRTQLSTLEGRLKSEQAARSREIRDAAEDEMEGDKSVMGSSNCADVEILSVRDKLQLDLNQSKADLEKERASLAEKDQVIEKLRLKQHELEDRIRELLGSATSNEADREKKAVFCYHTDVERLERELAHVKQSLQDVKCQRDGLDSQLKSCEAALKAKAETSRNLEEHIGNEKILGTSSVEDLNAEVYRLRRELKAAKMEIEEEKLALKLRTDEYEKERTDHETRLREKMNELKALEFTLHEERSKAGRLQILESELQDTRDEMESLRSGHSSTVNELRETISKLEGRQLASETVLLVKQESINELEQKLQDAINNTSTSTRDLRREVEDLRQRLSSTTEQLTKEKCELQAMDKFLKKIRNQHQEEIDERSSRIKELEEKLRTASKKERTLTDCIERLDATYQKAQNELLADREYLERKESGLREDVALLEKKLRVVESALKDAQGEIMIFESKLLQTETDSITTIAALRDDKTNLNERIDRKNEEIKDLELAVANLKDILDQKSQIICSLENEVSDERDSRENSEVNLKVQVSMLEGRVRANESSLKEKRKSCDKLEKELNRTLEELKSTEKTSRDKIDELTTKFSAAEQMLDEAQENLSSTRQRHSQELNLLKQALREKSDLIDSLEDKIQKDSDTEQSFQRKVADLETMNTELEASKLVLENEIGELKSKLDSTTGLLDKERIELDHYLNELNTVQQDLSQAKKSAIKVSEYEAKVCSLEMELTASQNESTALVDKLKNLQIEYDTITSRLLEREEENESNSKLLFDLERDLNVLRADVSRERQEKERLSTLSSTMQVEIERKDQQLERLPKLHLQLKDLLVGREELQEELGRVQADLERKEKQLTQTSEHCAASLTDMEANLLRNQRESERLAEALRATEAELERKSMRLERQVKDLESDIADQAKLNDDLKGKLRKAETEVTSLKIDIRNMSTEFSAEVQAKVESLTRTKATLESKIRELEGDRDDREKHMKESSERFSNKILELQMKVEELASAKSSLQSRLLRCESEREEKDDQLNASATKFSVEVAKLREQLFDFAKENNELQKRLKDLESQLSVSDDESKRLIEARTMEWQTKAEAESKEKRSLQARIRDVESEVNRKEKQIKDIVDRYANEIATLENRLDEESRAKSSLQRRLLSLQGIGEFEALPASCDGSEIGARIKALEEGIEVERSKCRESESASSVLAVQLEEQKNNNLSLKLEVERLRKVTSSSTDSTNETKDLLDKAVSLHKSIEETRTRAREAEVAKREAEEKISAQSETIAALKKEIDYLRDKSVATAVDSSTSWELRTRIISLEKSIDVERALSREADMARRQLERNLSELKNAKEKLEEEINEFKNKAVKEESSASMILRERINSLEKSIESERSQFLRADTKRVELENKLAEKENLISELEEKLKRIDCPKSDIDYDRLRSKISELEEKIEGERISTMRNEMARSELEAKLNSESASKAALTEELEQLRKTTFLVSGAASEARALKKQLAILENSVGTDSPPRSGTDTVNEDLQQRLLEAERVRVELEKRLEKINGERTEVINALEEVIHEVQSREDEIEALATILRKRDEELEHAKLIATKALATAQEIKSRYKGKGQERQAELGEKIIELQQKNEKLQSKAMKLDRELEERNRECNRLKEVIRESSLEKTSIKDRLELKSEKNGFVPLNEDFPPVQFGNSSSPTASTDIGTLSIDFNDSMSTQSADLNSPKDWLERNESDDHISFAQTEPSIQSRRSIERDALRKYVRKRYLKAKTESTI